jgi:transposase
MKQGIDVEYCALTLHRLWARGDSYQEIAAALGCSMSFVSRLKDRHKLPNRQRSLREVFENDPTPEQIAERAAECRARRPGPAEPKELRVSAPRYTWTGTGFRGIT